MVSRCGGCNSGIVVEICEKVNGGVVVVEVGVDGAVEINVESQSRKIVANVLKNKIEWTDVLMRSVVMVFITELMWWGNTFDMFL